MRDESICKLAKVAIHSPAPLPVARACRACRCCCSVVSPRAASFSSSLIQVPHPSDTSSSRFRRGKMASTTASDSPTGQFDKTPPSAKMSSSMEIGGKYKGAAEVASPACTMGTCSADRMSTGATPAAASRPKRCCWCGCPPVAAPAVCEEEEEDDDETGVDTMTASPSAAAAVGDAGGTREKSLLVVAVAVAVTVVATAAAPVPSESVPRLPRLPKTAVRSLSMSKAVTKNLGMSGKSPKVLPIPSSSSPSSPLTSPLLFAPPFPLAALPPPSLLLPLPLPLPLPFGPPPPPPGAMPPIIRSRSSLRALLERMVVPRAMSTTSGITRLTPCRWKIRCVRRTYMSAASPVLILPAPKTSASSPPVLVPPMTSKSSCTGMPVSCTRCSRTTISTRPFTPPPSRQSTLGPVCGGSRDSAVAQVLSTPQKGQMMWCWLLLSSRPLLPDPRADSAARRPSFTQRAQR